VRAALNGLLAFVTIMMALILVALLGVPGAAPPGGAWGFWIILVGFCALILSIEHATGQIVAAIERLKVRSTIPTKKGA
jgi:hypothetical protein